jgi:hypothetical protein
MNHFLVLPPFYSSRNCNPSVRAKLYRAGFLNAWNFPGIERVL